MQHLLLTEGVLPTKNFGLASCGHLRSLSREVSNIEWSEVNQYYFKCIASLQLLRQICLNFHKDFTLEQVDASNRNHFLLDNLNCHPQEFWVA